VVEVAILFPIMIMIFAALVLLAMYLPARAALQRATQYAATALACELGDTWLFYDESVMSYYWPSGADSLENVYSAYIKSFSAGLDGDKAEAIVRNIEKTGVITPAGTLTVEYGVVDSILYKEIIITATRTIPLPVNLSFINFPREIPITVTSLAVMQNGDELARNADLAADCFTHLNEKYQTTPQGLLTKTNEIRSIIDVQIDPRL